MNFCPNSFRTTTTTFKPNWRDRRSSSTGCCKTAASSSLTDPSAIGRHGRYTFARSSSCFKTPAPSNKLAHCVGYTPNFWRLKTRQLSRLTSERLCILISTWMPALSACVHVCLCKYVCTYISGCTYGCVPLWRRERERLNVCDLVETTTWINVLNICARMWDR